MALYNQFAEGRHRVKAVGCTVGCTIFDHRVALTLEVLNSDTMVVGDRVALTYTIKPVDNSYSLYSAKNLASTNAVARLHKYFQALQAGYHAPDGTREHLTTFIETHCSGGRQHIVDVEVRGACTKTGRPYQKHEWLPVPHTTPSIFQWGEPKIEACQYSI